MKKTLLKHIILDAIIILLISQTAFSAGNKKYSEYTGLYANIRNENYKMIFLEDNGKLYVQSLSGIFPIIFSSKTDFKVQVYRTKTGELPIHDRFSDFKNGRYQKIIIKQGTNESSWKRQDIPEEKYKSTLYDQIDRFPDIVRFNNKKLSPGQSFDVETGTLEEAGGNRSLIKKLIGLAAGRVDSLLVSKNGRLVVEEYFNGYSAEDSQNISSVSKCFTSFLLGDAIEKKYIKSINDPIKEYLPEYKSILTGKKKKITIKHLAENASGLDWNEFAVHYSNPENILNRAYSSPDPVEFVLSQPLIHKPGKVFTYNHGGTIVLHEILKRASGKFFDEYLKQSSLSQFDFKNAYWMGTLYMRPRDMLKIGQLVLNNGVWDGKQIVSEKWIKECTGRLIDTGASWDGYGYQWWHKTFKVGDRELQAVAGYGASGQKLVIVKELGLVIVTTRNMSDAPVLIVTDLVIEAFI